MAIAKVEPLTTARALRGPFDYRLPAEMADLEVGSVVRVPFGRRRALGVVVELAERSELPPERLAEPLEALEAGVPAELVRLGLWVAAEYCSTPSRGLQLVLPPGTGAAGQRVRSRTELRAAITASGSEALAGGGRLGAKQRAVLEALGGGEMSAGELAAAVGADSQVLRRLEQRELIATRRSTVQRRPGETGLDTGGEPPPLLDEQRAAVAEIVAALDGEAAASQRLLLHGVTGSGKTEVYLAAVEGALERGRGAIVLVPEIGLTPQTVARFRARLGDRFAVLHSALSAGERYDEWRRLRSGEASVCVGPRSAVFAPVRDLGLIVIDEEHDPSYKQEGDPCYDARAVARRRAGESGAVLVAGTATPRPESWLELPRLELPRRVDGRGMPPVELLDMREADPRSGPLHPATWEALDECARGGREGDRDGQPARLRALAHLPLLRAPLGLPELRRLADRPPPRRPARLPPLRPLGAAAGCLRRLRLDDAVAGRRRHRAGRGAAGRAPGAAAGPPARLRHGERARRPRAHPRRLRRGRERGARRHSDGRQGPRLPRGHAERDPRRRRDPALPRLPRRRAHLRDGRPARRSQRPRRGRREGDRADPGARGAEHRPRRPARLGRLPRRGDRAPPRAPLPALLPPGPGRAQGRVGATRRPGRREARRVACRSPARGDRAARPGADVPRPQPLPPPPPDQGRGPRGAPSRRFAPPSTASPPTAPSRTSRSASTSTLSSALADPYNRTE